MLTSEQVRNKLKDMNLKAVSKKSGVSYMTVYNFAHGKDCRATIVEKLSNYLEGKENGK